MYLSSRHYYLLICCLHVVFASAPPIRLPMEVFGTNSTQVNNSTVDDRKLMMQRHRSLLNTYGTAAAAALEQRRGRQMELEMQRTARILYQIGVSLLCVSPNVKNAIYSIQLINSPDDYVDKWSVTYVLKTNKGILSPDLGILWMLLKVTKNERIHSILKAARQTGNGHFCFQVRNL